MRVPVAVIVAVLAAAMVVAVGAVLAIGTPPAKPDRAPDALRNYSQTKAPAPLFTADLNSPALANATVSGVQIIGHAANRWLVRIDATPMTLYQLLDETGRPVGGVFNAGVGQCALTPAGVGCLRALASDGSPDGFFRISPTDGALTQVGTNAQARTVLPLGNDLLMLDPQAGTASRVALDGHIVWQRDGVGPVSIVGDHVALSGLSNRQLAMGAVIDAATGKDVFACKAACTITLRPAGFAYTNDSTVTVVSFAKPEAPLQIPSSDTIGQPESAIVTVPTGNAAVMAAGGAFKVIDPATATEVWNVSNEQLTKTAQACGDYIVFRLKDDTGATMSLQDSKAAIQAPSPQQLQSYDQWSCLGANKNVILWSAPNVGAIAQSLTTGPGWVVEGETANLVDGYLTVSNGTTVTVLRPDPEPTKR